MNYYIKKFRNFDEILTIENKKDKSIFWHLLFIHLNKKYIHLKKINDIFKVQKNRNTNSL